MVNLMTASVQTAFQSLLKARSFARSFARRLVTLAGTCVIALGLSGTALAQVEAPDALIKRVSTETLEKIQKDPELAAGDVKKINALIDQSIMQHVNFQRMTSLAVGRAWRTATPDQQKQLQAEFRTLLVRSYATAFSAGKDRTVRMKPLRAAATDTDVTVTSELVPKRGEPTPVGYRLEKLADGWKVYDLNVLGVWLVDNYRNQFSQEINAKGVDGLIKSLSDKNKTFGG